MESLLRYIIIIISVKEDNIVSSWRGTIQFYCSLSLLTLLSSLCLSTPAPLVHPRSRERHFEERRVIKPTRAEETRLLLGSGLSDSFSGNQKMHFPVSSQAPLAPILMIYYDTIWLLRRREGKYPLPLTATLSH